jgi:succinate dehydrogenase/fumarate reductase flavoprotein subunit
VEAQSLLLLLVPLGLGCRGPVAPASPLDVPDPSGTGGGDDGGGGADSGGPDSGGVDSGGSDSGGAALGDPSDTVDVLVIGAGPAGLSAAWEAQAAGARTLVLERSDGLGGNGWFGGVFYGVATSYQANLGVEDSVDAALVDWVDATDVTPDAQVQRMMEDSAGLIDWLVDDLGQHAVLQYEPGDVKTSRMHQVSTRNGPPVAVLIEQLSGLARTRTQADALVWEGESVVGVQWTDLDHGDTGWIAAGAVVVATGGFARDGAALVADRPALEGLTVLPEMGPTATGGGLPLLQDVAWQNQGHYGVYLQAIADPDLPGEALWPASLGKTVGVDGTGKRVLDESQAGDLRQVERWLENADRRLYAIYPASVWAAESFDRPAFNWADRSTSESVAPEYLTANGAAAVYSSLAELALGQGIDSEALAQTAIDWDVACAEGVDHVFGKTRGQLVPLGDGPYGVVEVLAGASKAFTGAAADIDGRLYDPAGLVIPGLYGAGEAIGMLGTEAVGVGFTGSLTAVYLTGRTSGANAAAYALANPR